MVTIFVDNKPVEVQENRNLLHACVAAGVDIPYFCWHPAFGSVGSCRQCAVKQFQNEADTRGKIVMACMTPVKAGMRISIIDSEAHAFRKAVIEWMMTNHPHDCPVCDEGGECHLQDMTVVSGHNYRRYRFTKRTFNNQNLGPFIHHEMNRCIQCYRCERYYRDVAGGRDFSSQSSRNHVFFGRAESGKLESEFSGNLIEVCPTGVFTDKTFRKRFARKWDLSATPSICPHCGVGCNITLGERYGTIRRTINRFHPDINGFFLCDRGRFGYEYMHSMDMMFGFPPVGATLRGRPNPNEINRPNPNEINRPNPNEINRPNPNDETNPNKTNPNKTTPTPNEPQKFKIGIGSPRASLETNYAIWKCVGAKHFFAGMTAREYDTAGEVLSLLKRHAGRIASVHDVEHADAVCIWGEDVINTAPRLGLAVRRSLDNVPAKAAAALGIPDWHDAAVRTVIQDTRGPLAIVSSVPTRLDEIASCVVNRTPDGIARLGYTVAHCLDPAAPSPNGLDAEDEAKAILIADMLRTAEMPVVVCGMSALDTGILQAVSNVMLALESIGKSAQLALVVPDWNTVGLMMLDPRPLLEGDSTELPKTESALIVETDLYRLAGGAEADRWFAQTPLTVVMDYMQHRSTSRATRVIPVAPPAASSGTVVNSEGRAQRFFQAVPPGGFSAAWKQIGLFNATGREAVIETLDECLTAIGVDFPQLEGILAAAPQKSTVEGKVPRQSHRFSGRTSMTADRDVHEPGTPEDMDSPLSYSMEGSGSHDRLRAFVWAPGLNSGQAGFTHYLAMQDAISVGDGSGTKLFHESGRKAPYYSNCPVKEQNHPIRLVPLYHIFGSEPLSASGEAIASLVPEAEVLIHHDDARQVGISNGDRVVVASGSRKFESTVRISERMARGVVACFVGAAGSQTVRYGEAITIVKGTLS